MCGVFYIYVLFTPHRFAFDKGPLIPLIFVTSLLGPWLIETFVNKNILPHRTEAFSRNLRWLLVILVVTVLDYYAFYGIFRKLGLILWGPTFIPTGAVYYFLFMLLLPFLIWRTNDRAKAAPTDRARTELRLASLAMALMLYFLGILTFAVRVFPFIPEGKGGGNFMESPTVSLHFKSPQVASSATADTLRSELIASNCYVVIDQDSTSLFLANTNDAGGPTGWQEMQHMPNIIQISRDAFDQISFRQAAQQ